MEFRGILESYAKLVEKEFPKYINRDVDELYELLRDLMDRGGKRLRPALCLLSCEAVGGKKEDALTSAASIEMVHNFTLIHDDIADKSELRRGRPCLHHKYGLGLAINAGDGLFSVAYEAIVDATSKMDKKKADGVLRNLATAVTAVSEGQARDIGWVYNRRWDLTEDDYFAMIRGKTGALIASSCAIGGIIGGGSKKEIEALHEYGMAIGIGFQIHDDVLNLRGDEKKYGKEIGGDINEGKRTLIVIHTLNVCTTDEKKFLIKVLDKERNSKEEIRSAIEIIDKYGSIERAAEVARNLVEDGKKGLRVLSDSKAKKTLIQMADYMIERDL